MFNVYSMTNYGHGMVFIVINILIVRLHCKLQYDRRSLHTFLTSSNAVNQIFDIFTMNIDETRLVWT